MLRYEDVGDDVLQVFFDVMEERFPQYQYLNFKLVYDLKKRVKGGKVTLASIELASAKIKYFSQDEKAAEGYDYVLFLDKKAWELSQPADKKRLISHELRHVLIDENGSPKIVGHEIEDFYEEIILNKDDPEWTRKLVRLVSDVYDQEKEMSGQVKGKVK
jgi:hypothetical protein